MAVPDVHGAEVEGQDMTAKLTQLEKALAKIEGWEAKGARYKQQRDDYWGELMTLTKEVKALKDALTDAQGKADSALPRAFRAGYSLGRRVGCGEPCGHDEGAEEFLLRDSFARWRAGV